MVSIDLDMETELRVRGNRIEGQIEEGGVGGRERSKWVEDSRMREER